MATTTLDCTKLTSNSKTWLKNGSKGQEVTTLQAMLQTLGYYTTSSNGSKLSIDGSFGPWTEKAVIAFQGKTGNNKDGKVGPATCKSLNDAITKVKTSKEVTGFDCSKTNLKLNQANDEEMVKLLQTHLKSLGYYTKVNGKELKIDGKYETYTAQAVEKFQRVAGGLQIDGWFGEATCKKFNKTIGATKYLAPKAAQTTTTTTTVKEDTVKKINVDDYQFLPPNEGNLTIGGLRFWSTSVSGIRQFYYDEWQNLEMMDRRNFTYMGHPLPVEFDVECILRGEDYPNVYRYFDAIGTGPVEVSGTMVSKGTYVFSMNIETVQKGWCKLLFHFLKFYEGGKKWF